MTESYIIDSLMNRIITFENIPPENSRFVNVNLVDTQNIVDHQTNANTKKIITECYLHLVEKWLKTRNKFRQIGKIE